MLHNFGTYFQKLLFFKVSTGSLRGELVRLREAQRILFDLLALAVNMAPGFELSVVFKIHNCCALR